MSGTETRTPQSPLEEIERFATWGDVKLYPKGQAPKGHRYKPRKSRTRRKKENKESLETQQSLFFWQKAGDDRRIKQSMNRLQDEIARDLAPKIREFIVEDARQMLVAVQFSPDPMARYEDLIPQQNLRLIEFFSALYAPVADDIEDRMMAEASQKGLDLGLEIKGTRQWDQELDTHYNMYGFHRIQNINHTTFQAIRDAFASGYGYTRPGQEDTYRYMQALIGRTAGNPLDQIIMGQQREHVITRTETAAAMNQSSLQVAKDSRFGATGYLTKEWSSTLDSRTRSLHSIYRDKFDHVRVHGQQRKLDEQFDVSGEKMDFPGDSKYGASAGNLISCRCVQIFVPGDPNAQLAAYQQMAFERRDEFLNDWYAYQFEREQSSNAIIYHRQAIEDYQDELAKIYARRPDMDLLNRDDPDVQRILYLNSSIEESTREFNILMQREDLKMPWEFLKQDPDQNSRDWINDLNYHIHPDIEDYEVTEGIMAFRDLVGAKVFEDAGIDQYTLNIPFRKSVKELGKRFSAYYSNGTVHLRPYDDAKTVVHELGHWLEEKVEEIHNRALDFLQDRTAGEDAQKLAYLTGNTNYDPWEMAKPDAFFHPYVGKMYGARATEVISMGIEEYYSNPVEFAQNDPEYFDFITFVLNGWY
jgi:hypothetical protein